MPEAEGGGTSAQQSNACRTGQSDSGKNAIGIIGQLAALAVAGYTTAVAITLANKQHEIAKDYLEMSEWWRDYYNSVYRPWEDREIADLNDWNTVEPEYDITMGQTRTTARIQFKNMDYTGIRCTSEYCTGLREAMLKDAHLAEAAATAAMSNVGYQNEKAWVEARNDARWKRILAVLNRGRDMIAENINFMSLSYGIYADLGEQAMQTAGGAIGFLGYARNRRETQYPSLGSVFTTRINPPTPQAPTPAPTRMHPTSGHVATAAGMVPVTE